MHVVTLNLWGQRGSWEDRRSILIEGLRGLRPDLVALQESIVTLEYDQVDDLLGSTYQIIHQRARSEDGQGISIASRWPVDAVHELDLHVTPRTAGFPCGTLIVEARAPDPVESVIFVNHFPSWQLSFEYERELQTVAAARFVENLVEGHNTHVVVAGDLDADPAAASIRFWSGRQSLDGASVCYRDAWESAHPGDPGHTFTPRNGLMNDLDWPFRRIDYILVRCGLHGGPTLAIDSCRLIFDEPIEGVWASDHFGLTADLTIPHSQGATS